MSKQQWTQAQLSAITARDCNLLVAAAAGAGKTAVLVERILRRIVDPLEPVDVDRLLVVTFTNAAAAEMRERIGQAIAARINQDHGQQHLEHQLALLPMASITTLHSFCLEVLRQHYFRLDLDPAFRIADETEVALLKLHVLEELLEDHYTTGDPGFLSLVDCYGGDREDTRLQELILNLHRFSRSNPWPAGWLEEALTSFLVQKASSIEDSPWGRSLLQSAAITLEGALSQLEKAWRLCSMPGGPQAYQGALTADLAMMQDLLRACKGSWEALQDRFHSLTWERLRPCSKDVDETLKERVKKIREGVKNDLASLAEVFSRPALEHLADLQALAPFGQTLIQLVMAFEGALQKAKRSQGIVDFNDLEHFCLALLTAPGTPPGEIIPSDIACEFRRRFAEVLVDEYQDINPVQEAILQLVSRQGESRPNLFMVGDVKQSIYRFRLAEPRLFLRKYRSFPIVAGGLERRVDLANNFRCRREVVDAVNFIFRQIMTERVGEVAYDRAAELALAAVYPEVEEDRGRTLAAPVEFHLIERYGDQGTLPQEELPQEEQEKEETVPLPEDEVEDLEAMQMEARIIARRIIELMQGCRKTSRPYLVYDKNYGYRPLGYRDIVVLLRATRGAANTLLEEFRLAGIPAYAELGTGYFEAIEVEAALSLLRIIDNPQQDVPLAAALRLPPMGLTAEEFAQIRLACPEGNLYQALKGYAAGEQGELAKKISAFLERLEQWRTLARQGSLSELIWQIYRDTGYYDFVGGLPGGRQRQANLRALQDRARQYETTMFRGLFYFLRFIKRLQESGSDMGAARALGENEDVVRIMSVHKSKGLEFPVVFVAGLGKQFNLRDAKEDTLLHKDLGIGLDVVDLAKRVKYPSIAKIAIRERLRLEALAEEMRILYVAMTRAREKLILVASTKKLRARLEEWSLYANVEEWSLPDKALAGAKACLDWLGPALLRHPDAAPLSHFLQAEVNSSTEAWQDSSQWSVFLWEPRHCQQAPTEKEAGELFKRLKNLQPLDILPEEQDRVEKRLNWAYPHKSSLGKAAKVAVTEIKRRFNPEIEEAEQAFPRPFIPAEAARPSFVAAKGFSTADRGSAYHLVMQHLNFQGSLTPEGIRGQVQEMICREILAEEQARAVDPENLARFFAGSLGRRLLSSPEVRREIPFSLVLPAGTIYPDLGQTLAEKVLVQGVIDCLFGEEDGLVLIDWKTDQVDPRRLEPLVASYGGQLNLYAHAVEIILRRPVKEKYLFLLMNGLEVKV
ncbi:MAG: helicase-exonuclease AddAB subunit AddA [Bacillota bacterium]